MAKALVLDLMDETNCRLFSLVTLKSLSLLHRHADFYGHLRQPDACSCLWIRKVGEDAEREDTDMVMTLVNVEYGRVRDGSGLDVAFSTRLLSISSKTVLNVNI